MRAERPGAGLQLCLALPCLTCIAMRGHAFEACVQLNISAQHCSGCSALNSFLDEQALHGMPAKHEYGRA